MSQEIDLVVKICGSKFLHSTIVSKEQLSRLNIDAKEQKIQEKDFLSLQTDCNGCQQHLTLNVFWYDDEHLVKREPRVVIEPLINIKEEIKQSDDDDSMDFDDHEDTKSSEEKPFVYEKSGVTKYISYPGLTYLLPPGLQLPSFDNVEVPYFAKIKQKDGSVVYAEKKRKKKCPVRITNYDPRVVNCDICGYKVPSADRLTAHRKGHMFFRFADEICRGCGKNCGDSHAEKLNHSFFCVGKDKINGLACPECPRYVAKDYKKLRNHMKKKHKGYNPVPEPNRENEVTCELCGTKALDDYALHLHQKFKCPMNEEYLAQTKAFTEGYLKDLDLPATVVLPDIYKIKGKQSQMIPQADGTQIYFSKGTNYLEIMNFDPRREKCELCGKSHMLKKSEIVEHRLKRHFFPNENDTECPGCGKHCHTLAQKTTHSHFCPLKHSIRVNYCEKCATPYPNYSKYAKHLLRRHDGEGLDKKFMCHFCSATYDTNRELLQHVIRHDDPRPFKCHHCSEDFKGKTGVEGHLIRTHFPHESKFSCQTCETPQLFGTLKSYKAHMNAVHFKTKEREACRYCGIMIRKAGMETHVRRQHTEHDLKEKFACQTCGKLFVSANNLKVHERVHLPEHQRAHKCRFCERRFNSNRVCIEHERYHTGDKPYKCDICGKAYARSQTLKDHQREHTGEGFRCTVCSKMLTDRGNFRHHMKQHESQLGVKLTLNHEDRRLIKLKVITEEQAFRGDGPGK